MAPKTPFVILDKPCLSKAKAGRDPESRVNGKLRVLGSVRPCSKRRVLRQPFFKQPWALGINPRATVEGIGVLAYYAKMGG